MPAPAEGEPRWTSAFALTQLPPGGGRLLKQGASQVAIFHLEGGVFHAVDNRCPHQGYPLLQGSVVGSVLTCKWHNFKFNLRDGACVLGEEGVRTYPVRVVDGQVEVNLEPPATLLAGLWRDLETAMERHEPGRMARGVIRLLDLGVPPAEVAYFGALFDGARAEYGGTHALAAAAALAERLPPGVDPALPLVQGLDVAARSNVRLPVREFAPPVDPGSDPIAAGARLRALVEAEQGREAEALVRGAVARGWRRTEIEPWFFQLCADHFLDFGHALIFATQVFPLLDAMDWRGADTVLGTLVWSIAHGTREDLLPAWTAWRRRVDEPTPAALGGDALAALSLAAATRLLRFDLTIDADPTVAEGWLDVTHRLTFVHAVREACARWDAPDARRLVLQAAHFVGMALPLDGAPPPLQPVLADVDSVVDSVAQRRTDEAVNRAAGYLASGADARALVDALERLIVRDHATRAIFLIHQMKTLRAGASERLATQDDHPLLGAVRYLASPVRERSVERSVHEAIALVRHGRPPRTLTG